VNGPDDVGIVLRPNADGTIPDPTGMAAHLRRHAAALRSAADFLDTHPSDRGPVVQNNRSDLHAVDGTVIGQYMTRIDEANTDGVHILRQTILHPVRANPWDEPPIRARPENRLSRTSTTLTMSRDHDAPALRACADEDEAFARLVEDRACLDRGFEVMERFLEMRTMAEAYCLIKGADLASLTGPTIEIPTTRISYMIEDPVTKETSWSCETDPKGPVTPLHRIGYTGIEELDLFVTEIRDRALPPEDAVEILRILGENREILP
jgi:hypothetical protein